MAYETGTATGAVDLLDKFRVFAESQGWTTNRWVVAGSGRELCISKGKAYFNFRAWQNESMLVSGTSVASKYGITLNGSENYSSGSAWDRQPGYAKRLETGATDQGHALLPLVTNFGPFPAYHFFAPDSKTLYCELEVTTGCYHRMGVGSLDLFNPSCPGGGRFFYGTSGAHVTNAVSGNTWLNVDMDNSAYQMEFFPFRAASLGTTNNASVGVASFVRAISGSTDGWASSGRNVGTVGMPLACQGGGCHDRVMRDYGAAPLNGVGVMLPNIVSLNVGDEYLSPIGVLPGIRHLDITPYLAGNEFTLGSDVWKVFPWYQKGGIGYQRGIAYKKVT